MGTRPAVAEKCPFKESLNDLVIYEKPGEGRSQFRNRVARGSQPQGFQNRLIVFENPK